ncbi:MAG: glycosyltransferase [Deltaproteobacteria bacterium]|nr:glycosyltransferase [Deltaproteobacteria bacterium]
MSENHPETSIVIRAFNEERWLPEVFSALDKQHYRDFEVVVVDSGSVDRTREIAATNGARIVSLRSEDFTFGYALNVGIREARGSLIAILSAHAIPSNEFWLERLVKPLREVDTAMVYGGQRGHDKFSKFSEKRDFERLFKPQVHLVHEDDPFTNNANSAIKRDLWLKHSFDEMLPGLEDTEWSKYWVERGMRILYEPNARIIHVHNESWPQLRNRYYREAMAARKVGRLFLRHIPREIWREIRWCCHDLLSALIQERFSKFFFEILRFRYGKMVGTISGIIDSRRINNPVKRPAIFTDKEYSALVINGPKDMRLENRVVPTMKPGEILIHVSHVGVCGTDLDIIDGKLGYYQSGLAHYPIVPGHEVSGTVVSLGPRVSGLSEGDRVVVECIQGCGDCSECARDEAIRCRERREVGVIRQDGGYSTYLVTRARYAHRVPADVTLAEAALTEPLAVVLKGLRRLGSVPNGDRPRECAVFGAGTIGHLSARVLALRGHSVTVFDRESGRLSLLNGAVSTSQSLEGLERYEWLIEATGAQTVLSKVVQESSTGATLLLLGLPYSDQTFNFESIVAFDRSIIGSVGSSGSAFEEALATLPKIDTAPFLRAIYPLEQIETAMAAARSRSFLKVMLKPDANTV